MKKILLLGLICILLPLSELNAQACDIHLKMVDNENNNNISDDIKTLLDSRVSTALLKNGIVAGKYSSNLFITNKLNLLSKEFLPGPPINCIIDFELTLYIGDTNDEKIYSSVTFNLKGVGKSEKQAFIQAFKSNIFNSSNINSFVEEGKAKVLDYYNKNYKMILLRAEKSAKLKQYDAALYSVMSIPECSVGYSSAEKVLEKYYHLYINYNSQKMLKYAQSAWVSNPNSEGAEEALSIINEIDPDSNSASGAKLLFNEIKTKLGKDWNFENRQIYSDELDLKKRQIEGARAVGVAYGNHQPNQTVHLNWIK